MGGEKFTSFLYCSTCAGSPLRGRGKAEITLGQFNTTGITPAWAGKSYTKLPDEERCEDHPCVGGEKTKKIP